MTVYIIEYRCFEIGDHIEQVCSHISQEGYTSLEAAQAEIERRPCSPTQVTPMLYQTPCCEEYAIHDIKVLQRD